MTDRNQSELHDRILAVAPDLFGQAVAQGMHAPFALNCEEWGRTYTEKLIEALGLGDE